MSHENHTATSTAKNRDGLSLRKPDIDSSNFKHGNPVSKDARNAPSVTGDADPKSSNYGSHDRAWG